MISQAEGIPGYKQLNFDGLDLLLGYFSVILATPSPENLTQGSSKETGRAEILAQNIAQVFAQMAAASAALCRLAAFCKSRR